MDNSAQLLDFINRNSEFREEINSRLASDARMRGLAANSAEGRAVAIRIAREAYDDYHARQQPATGTRAIEQVASREIERPSLLSETDPDNASVVRRLAGAVARGQAKSLTGTVMEMTAGSVLDTPGMGGGIIKVARELYRQAGRWGEKQPRGDTMWESLAEEVSAISDPASLATFRLGGLAAAPIRGLTRAAGMARVGASGAGGIGLHAGLTETARQAIEGELRPLDIAKETGIGVATGAALAPAGAIGARTLAKAGRVPLTAAEKVIQKTTPAAKLATEAAIFAEVGAVREGRALPTMEEGLYSLAFLSILRTTQGLPKRALSGLSKAKEGRSKAEQKAVDKISPKRMEAIRKEASFAAKRSAAAEKPKEEAIREELKPKYPTVQEIMEGKAPKPEAIKEELKPAPVKTAEVIDSKPLELPPETAVQLFQRKVQDKMNRLGRVVKEAAKREPVSDAEDAYMQAELFIGRATERIDRFRQRAYESKNKNSLLVRAQRAGFSVKDLHEYLWADHAQERNAHVRGINEKLPDGGSGMMDAKAKAVVEKWKGSGIEKFAGQVRDIARETLELKRDAGLIDQATFEHLSGYYSKYVPLLREMEAMAVARPRASKGFSVTGKDVRRAKGSERPVLNTVSSIVAAHEEAIVRAEKNRVGQSFLTLAEKYPSSSWEVEKLQYTPRYDKDGEIAWMDPRYKYADNVMEVKVAGKTKLITIHDEPLAKAMKNLGAERGVAALHKINAYLRGVATTYNPEFLVTNLSRDAQTAGVHLAGEHGKAIMAKTMRDLPAAMGGIYREVRGGEPGEWPSLYAELKAMGGKVGWFDQKTLSEKLGVVEKEMRRAETAGLGKQKLQRSARALGEFVNNANEVVESGVRLSAYKNLVESGISKQRAAQVAKNLTVNFNKKGEWGSTINSLYLFANAGIQGSARIIFSIGKSKKTRAIVSGITAMGFLESYLNNMIAPDDYEKMDDWEKDNYWIMMRPDGERFKIKVPYGYNIFKTIGNVTAEYQRGDVDLGRASSRFMASLNDAFNPFGAGSFAQTISPTATDWLVQLGENKNFFGGPIRPEQPVFGPKKPRSQLAFKSARPLSTRVAHGLNRITGGNERLSGGIDVSPESIDHIVDFWTSGTGKFVGNAIATGGHLARGERPPYRKVPFLRQFYGEPTEYAEMALIWEMNRESGRKLYNPIERAKYEQYLNDAVKKGVITAKKADEYRRAFTRNQEKATGVKPRKPVDYSKIYKELRR